MSLKCPECGLSNFDTATDCKRCQAPLATNSTTDNIWRDGNCLVINVESFALPERCLKCNSDLYLSKEVLELDFYPLYSYLMVLFVRRVVVWKRFTIPTYLCSEHHRIASAGPTNTALPNLLIILGSVALIMGVFIQEAALLFWPLGLGLLVFGLLLYKLTRSAFRITKRAKKMIWIKGVDQQYLALLPSRKYGVRSTK